MKRTPCVHILILTAFLVNTFGPAPTVYAQEFRLPVPCVMVRLSPPFDPPILKGIKVHPDNPFRLDFIMDVGNGFKPFPTDMKKESTKLIKYFLASLTIPEKDLWVNLSPYEKDRIIPQSFGLTEMGRDLLAEDYMLKQITASLIYPEDETGKKFWKRIYEEAKNTFGTTNIPVNTFNKVWIVPEKAVVYENAKAGTAYVVEGKLKVMLEQDYLSMSKHGDVGAGFKPAPTNINALGSSIIREIVIPELTKEVNENKNFVHLRQVYNSLILATWYKKKIKDSILAQVYADKNKTAGVGYKDSPPLEGGVRGGGSNDVERIYQRYLQAFKKGVYNYIKEEQDPITQETISRKYFSGGVQLGLSPVTSSMGTTEGILKITNNPTAAMLSDNHAMMVVQAVVNAFKRLRGNPAVGNTADGGDAGKLTGDSEESAREELDRLDSDTEGIIRFAWKVADGTRSRSDGEVLLIKLQELGNIDLSARIFLILWHNSNPDNPILDIAARIYSDIQVLGKSDPEGLELILSRHAFEENSNNEESGLRDTNLNDLGLKDAFRSMQRARQLIRERGLQDQWIQARNLSAALKLFDTDLPLADLIGLASVFLKDHYDIDLSVLEYVKPSDAGRLRERLIEWGAVLANFEKGFLRMNQYFGAIQVYKTIRATHGSGDSPNLFRGILKISLDDDARVLLHEMGHAFDPKSLLEKFSGINIYSNIDAEKMSAFAQEHGYSFDLDQWRSGSPKDRLSQLSALIDEIYIKRRSVWADLSRSDQLPYYDDRKDIRRNGFWESYLSKLKERQSFLATIETISPFLAQHVRSAQEILREEIEKIEFGLRPYDDLRPGDRLPRHLWPPPLDSRQLPIRDKAYMAQVDVRRVSIDRVTNVIKNLFEGIIAALPDFVDAKAGLRYLQYIYIVPSGDIHPMETVNGQNLRAEHTEFFAESFRWFMSEGIRSSYDSPILAALDPEMSQLMRILFPKAVVEHSYQEAGTSSSNQAMNADDLIGKEGKLNLAAFEEIIEKAREMANRTTDIYMEIVIGGGTRYLLSSDRWDIDLVFIQKEGIVDNDTYYMSFRNFLEELLTQLNVMNGDVLDEKGKISIFKLKNPSLEGKRKILRINRFFDSSIKRYGGSELYVLDRIKTKLGGYLRFPEERATLEELRYFMFALYHIGDLTDWRYFKDRFARLTKDDRAGIREFFRDSLPLANQLHIKATNPDLNQQLVDIITERMRIPLRDLPVERDFAMKNTGGIDLTPANMNLQTQNNGGEIKFHLDPAQLAQLQNAPGFVPVIISIQPMIDLRMFLGINDPVKVDKSV